MIKLTIISYAKKWDEDILKISIPSSQERFSGNAKLFLDDKEEDVDKKLIFVKDKLIGCFKIDKTYAENYEFCDEGFLGLRALFYRRQRAG